MLAESSSKNSLSKEPKQPGKSQKAEDWELNEIFILPLPFKKIRRERVWKIREEDEYLIISCKYLLLSFSGRGARLRRFFLPFRLWAKPSSFWIFPNSWDSKSGFDVWPRASVLLINETWENKTFFRRKRRRAEAIPLSAEAEKNERRTDRTRPRFLFLAVSFFQFKL